MSSAAVEGCTQLGNAIDGVNANDQAGWSEGGNAIAASADGTKFCGCRLVAARRGCRN
jgi:hypothetical protein